MQSVQLVEIDPAKKYVMIVTIDPNCSDTEMEYAKLSIAGMMGDLVLLGNVRAIVLRGATASVEEDNADA